MLAGLAPMLFKRRRTLALEKSQLKIAIAN
jgi:hypothetical protein